MSGHTANMVGHCPVTDCNNLPCSRECKWTLEGGTFANCTHIIVSLLKPGR